MQEAAGVVVLILLVILFRAFMLWYWRLNDIVDTLQEMNENIAKIAGVKTKAQLEHEKYPDKHQDIEKDE